jgi:hypothetical protein
MIEDLTLAERLGFNSVGKSVESEILQRKLLVEGALPFGIKFLDKSLRGILAHDLVLIGAKPGIGKTETLTTIAKTNVLLGKRVAFFALEAEPQEIERRIKFQRVTSLYNQMNFLTAHHQSFNYRDWFYGDYDEILKPYEDMVHEDMKAFENLYVYYRKKEFSVKDFEREVMAIKDDVDLIIADHIHYFDLFTDNENRELADVIKKIKDLVQITGKPVVLAGHLRKSQRNERRIIPDLEDFHGSSDLPKIITKGIILAQDQYPTKQMNFSATLMRVVKSRLFGSATKYVGLCYFDTNTNEYINKFGIVRLTTDETDYEVIDEKEWPEWLK